MSSPSRPNAFELASFNELYQSFKKPIYGYCLRMLGDTDSAKDITQQVFITLHERGGEIQHPEKVSAWLFTVARHACLTLIGQQAKHTSLDDASPVGSIPSDGDNLTLSRLISRAVARLEPDYREVIVLREYHDLSYADIAETTGTNVSTIKFRLFAARRKLAKLLQPTLGKGAKLRGSI